MEMSNVNSYHFTTHNNLFIWVICWIITIHSWFILSNLLISEWSHPLVISTYFSSTKLHMWLKNGDVVSQFLFKFNNFLFESFVESSQARTTDAQSGNSLHCMAENSLPLPNFYVRPKHILSATSAQFFRYLWFIPSLGVRRPWSQDICQLSKSKFLPLNNIS
jgi:hypothetical protein